MGTNPKATQIDVSTASGNAPTAPAGPEWWQTLFQDTTKALLQAKVAKIVAKKTGGGQVAPANLVTTSPQADSGGGMSKYLLIGGGVLLVIVVALVAMRGARGK